MDALLACLTEDVRWQPAIGTAPHVPFSGERQGKASVAEYFRLVAETEMFEEFAPHGQRCDNEASAGAPAHA